MTIKQIGLVSSFVAAAAGTAVAGQIQVGYSGSSYGPYQTGQGGEFTYNPLTGWLDVSGYGPNTKNIGVAGTFQTFCLEGNETLNGYNATYTAAMNKNAMDGGVVGLGDPLSVGTGWLYKQFASQVWEGSLSYNYGAGGRLTSANALQQAIWWLEGEKSVAYDLGNIYMAAAVGKFITQAGAKVDGAWNYGVYALNMTTANGGLAQDGLYYVRTPDGGFTLLMLGTGLFGLALARRRTV
ncbi:MAG: VPDSG-CTERM sorting domain-containing protein [Gammaproteobacteria bacterium]|nr:VPDSG-CTERM sorting domain-containing protein [Gammaproteobacteria bacterium]